MKETVDEWECCFDNEGFIGRAGDRDGVTEPTFGWCDDRDAWPGKNFDGRDLGSDVGENWRF